MMKNLSRTFFCGLLFSLGIFLPNSRAGGIDLTRIVSKADAETLLGGSVGEPNIHQDESADGLRSKIDYRCPTTRKTVSLAVVQTKAGAPTPEQRLAILNAGESRLQPVSGIGSKAVFFDSGAAEFSKAGRLTMLYVVKGNAFVSVGLGGVPDPKAALEKEKEIAQKILAQL